MRAAVERRLAAANAVFSTYDPHSEISRFNAHRSTEPFAASREMSALVRLALEIAAKTGGAFDPTVMPLVNLWGFGPAKPGHPPSEEEIARARARIGYRKIEVMPGGALRKAVADVELDLSAIAKGLAADEVAAEVARLGARGAMVEVGGEVRCHGRRADGKPWVIGIERPPGRGILEKVEPGEGAVATSGSYRNFVRAGGRTVFHIFDPRTGENAPGRVISVSVRAPTCALADGLATAFMVLGPDGAEQVLDRFAGQDLRLLFVLRAEGDELETVKVRW